MTMSDTFRDSVPTRTPAVVELYKDIGFQSTDLSDSLALTLAAFDCTAASQVWYEWEPALMDLFSSFNFLTVSADALVPARGSFQGVVGRRICVVDVVAAGARR